MELLNRASVDEADFPSFLLETRSQLVYNGVAELLNQKKMDEAEDFLGRYGSNLKDSDRNELELQIGARQLEERAAGPFNPRFIEDLNTARERGVLTRSRAASMAAYHYSLESQNISRREGNTAAYLFFSKAPLWVQSDREYKRIFSILQDNTAIEYHNRVVSLMREDRKSEAEAVLNEGLDLIPSSNILKQDRRKLFP